MVKASFRRNRHNGAWARHARYLARERAQDAKERGVGFDSTRDGLDIVDTVRAWEKSDELMWSFIVSPEDAKTDRSAAAFARPGRGHGARSWDAARMDRDRSPQHR